MNNINVSFDFDTENKKRYVSDHVVKSIFNVLNHIVIDIWKLKVKASFGVQNKDHCQMRLPTLIVSEKLLNISMKTSQKT
jgi:hypothetical protein